MPLNGGDVNQVTPKVALLTFIYPIAEPYYRETLASMLAQSYDHVDVIVVNDGVENADLPESVFVQRNEQGLGLIALRQSVFNQLIDDGYDLIINIDADDTMSEGRVAQVVCAWETTPEMGFYYSRLHYLSARETSFFINLPVKLEGLEAILESNFVGLSHVSINAAALREVNFRFSFPDDLIALDWYMASILVESGFSGMRDDGKVYYRIYGENTAGEIKNISMDKYERAVDVKCKHYQALKDLKLSDKNKAFVDGELARLTNVKSKIKSEGGAIDLSVVNHALSKNTNNYWWANI